ncbi:cupin domain-containing protein [Desulfovibrio ferrophilus]|uniref:Cupin 2 conserved barrel domain protein n=1 Tax=Desulfovibrio ferrophilus TaxID=241368 RepID=A0A2Z6AVJ1_9BACT|nr:cupin domain-containing protein [Desulfovibrio ferrophilus]BBD07254.1 cupin 2 conserved barrel domain protein [Desulfovibrio ferrophilus]
MNNIPFQNACVAATDATRPICELEWNAHPAFEGVHIKDLITGADTGGRLSCHLVRVAPGCCLKEHDHPTQTELHQVAAGQGTCMIQEKKVAYHPGEMAIIPQGERHSVMAGEHGLTLVATFSPPLK